MLNKWKQGLAKTSKAAFGQIASILGVTEITDQTWEDLEDLLIQSDLGIVTSESVLESLWERERREGITTAKDLRIALHEELRKRLDKPPEIALTGDPAVIIVVGVNGSGKTTTIAKLGKRFTETGKQVILGAADTYRAAAVDQLEIWAKRANLQIISGQPGGDPGAVAYDAIHSAKSRGFDVVIIDTAGRLHTRHNLMEELKKVNRVVSKALPGAPHHVWLVMDATTGQNALQQARAFKEAVNVTGVILAKLDSSARGGMAFAIQHDLNLPILFAGLGEGLDDLELFDPDAFLDGILSKETK
ncbi:MAG: signal recognition particle-docking protein FtsY [Anaerolineales bacterium]|nr:signal recognition particle-docking protein FtsY [Anaerolineales bacterium]